MMLVNLRYRSERSHQLSFEACHDCCCVRSNDSSKAFAKFCHCKVLSTTRDACQKTRGLQRECQKKKPLLVTENLTLLVILFCTSASFKMSVWWCQVGWHYRQPCRAIFSRRTTATVLVLHRYLILSPAVPYGILYRKLFSKSVCYSRSSRLSRTC